MKELRTVSNLTDIWAGYLTQALGVITTLNKLEHVSIWARINFITYAVMSLCRIRIRFQV